MEGYKPPGKLDWQDEKIREIHARSVALADELGIPYDKVFWAHVVLYAAPDFPDHLDATVYCNGSRD
jgi:hypothetical protein